MGRKDKPALVLVDFQKGFDNLAYWGGERSNPRAELNAGRLLGTWRMLELPVFHVRHSSATPGSPLVSGEKGFEFKEGLTPRGEEHVITKQVNSAFIGTNLKEEIDNLFIYTLVIAGFTTDQCVSTTARMSGNFGYDTYVAGDATVAFCKSGYNGQHYPAELIHDTALASIHKEFAVVMKTEQLIEQVVFS